MDTSIFHHSKTLLGSMPQGVFGAADLFCTVSSLSARLGYQSPLLDEYISAVLESAATFSAYDAQSHGYEAASRLMELARGVTPDPVVPPRKRLYSELLRAGNALGPDEPACLNELRELETKRSIYFIELSDAYFFDAYEDYLLDMQSRYAKCACVNGLEDVTARLAAVLGQETLQNLYDKLHQMFFPCTALESFRRGYYSFLLKTILHEDGFCHRQVWQLWADFL